ncbi:hypothetical protein DRN98_01090 [Methanosarcinales archaeon]|uniref:Uncharacterized protein n=1 Tax=Candidatus Syntropharchaeum caldarium TaxID=1838285 RepID=A0A1F2PBR5_9EURY|nr:MAG: hypothetical protein SCAL_000354 [Candidatus Syntrophoarchaeum caldarius]RLG35501.1 MAG: hypothetical protein DRN98_01090 [Methanosarcinales archaeon]
MTVDKPERETEIAGHKVRIYPDPSYPRLSWEEDYGAPGHKFQLKGANAAGPCIVKCPTCGHTMRKWHLPGKAFIVPPDRKIAKTVFEYCSKCGSIIVLNGVLASPWVSPERVKCPYDLSIKKFSKQEREVLPDDRGW